LVKIIQSGSNLQLPQEITKTIKKHLDQVEVDKAPNQSELHGGDQ